VSTPDFCRGPYCLTRSGCLASGICDKARPGPFVAAVTATVEACERIPEWHDGIWTLWFAPAFVGVHLHVAEQRDARYMRDLVGQWGAMRGLRAMLS